MTKDQKTLFEKKYFDGMAFLEIEKQLKWSPSYRISLQDIAFQNEVEELRKIRTKFTPIRKEGFAKSNKGFLHYEKICH